jgi:HEAT repeat protein
MRSVFAACLGMCVTLAAGGRSAAEKPPRKADRPADKSVQDLLKQVKSTDVRTAIRAYGELQRLGLGETAVETLIDYLKDNENLVRDATARSLAHIGAPAVPPLTTLLGDPDEKMRTAAVAALTRMGPAAKSAVPRLKQLSRKGPGALRLKAAAALWRIDKDRAAFKQLTRAVLDRDLRMDAAGVLGDLGPDARDAVPAMVLALKAEGNGSNRGWILFAIGRLGAAGRAAVPAVVAALRDPDESVRSTAASTLGDIGLPAAAAAPALTACLKTKGTHLREMAAGSLGFLGPAAEPAVPALVQVLADPNAGVRSMAVLSLGRVARREKQVVPALMAALKDKETDLRRFAATALGEFGPAARAAGPARAGLLRYEETNVRTAAAEALGKLGAEAAPAVPDLRRALGDDYAEVRAAAARALGEIGPVAKAALPALGPAVHDADMAVQVQAALALWRIDRRQEVAVRTLLEALKKEECEAAHALGELGQAARAAGPALEAAWKGPDPLLCVAAAGALWRMGLHREATMRALVEAVATDDGLGWWDACRALEAIGPDARAALPALRRALDRARLWDSRTLADTLRKIEQGSEGTVP